MTKQKQDFTYTPIFLLSLVASLSISGCGLVPEPLSKDELNTFITEDKTTLFNQQEPLTEPLTLYQAMARALKYNLDHRVKIMERAMAEGQSTVARFDLLPDLMASAGYRNRDNFNASSSKSITTGQQSLVTSTSQDRTRYLGDLVFRWNILDFGVSYLRARQESNKALAAEENRRKISHSLTQDVRGAYWRAVSAQTMEKEIEPILADANKALALSRESNKEQLKPPLEALRYQKSLIEIIRRLDAMLDQQKMAKSELAGMINYPRNQPLVLAVPAETALPAAPNFDMPIEQLEELALQMRPELRQEMYQTRIGVEEIHKAMLRILPGVEVSIGGHHDSNSYLLNKDFAEIGAQISKNVFELLSAPASIHSAEVQKSLADSRRMASYMAILTQVHLAKEQLELSRKQFDLALELDQLNQQIRTHTDNSTDIEAMSPLERIRTTLDAIMSKLQRQQSFADIQSAVGKMYVSLGFDPLPYEVQSHEINVLAQAIEAVDKEWAQGHFPHLPEPPAETDAATASAIKEASTSNEETPSVLNQLMDWKPLLWMKETPTTEAAAAKEDVNAEASLELKQLAQQSASAANNVAASEVADIAPTIHKDELAAAPETNAESVISSPVAEMAPLATSASTAEAAAVTKEEEAPTPATFPPAAEETASAIKEDGYATDATISAKEETPAVETAPVAETSAAAETDTALPPALKRFQQWQNGLW